MWLTTSENKNPLKITVTSHAVFEVQNILTDWIQMWKLSCQKRHRVTVLEKSFEIIIHKCYSHGALSAQVRHLEGNFYWSQSRSIDPSCVVFPCNMLVIWSVLQAKHWGYCWLSFCIKYNAKQNMSTEWKNYISTFLVTTNASSLFLILVNND